MSLKRAALPGLLALALIAAAMIAAHLFPARQTAAADEAPRPAPGYVLVQTDSLSGWLPLPETEEQSYTYPIRQINESGELVENHLHLTPEGVYMAFATCENQDCVNQGMVTLENKDSRVLMNYILCLPNRVSVALYTPDEVLAMYSASPEKAE